MTLRDLIEAYYRLEMIKHWVDLRGLWKEPVRLVALVDGTEPLPADLQQKLDGPWSRAEIAELRQELRAQLAALDRAEAGHPDAIRERFKNYFVDGAGPKGLAEIVASVEFIEDIEGWTHSRKNPIHWDGWRYKFKDSQAVYWFRHGENWCDGFTDCGNDGDEAADEIKAPSVDMDDPDWLLGLATDGDGIAHGREVILGMLLLGDWQ